MSRYGDKGTNAETSSLVQIDTVVDIGDVQDGPSYELSIRAGLIRKVYGILSAQLLLTFGAVLYVLYEPQAKVFMLQHSIYLNIAAIVSLAMVIVLSCCRDLARKHPENLVMLGAFTVAEAYLVAACTVNFETSSVVLAVGITAVIFVGLTLYTLFSKDDFSGMGPYLYAFLLVFFFGSMIRLLLPTSPFTETLWGCLGALLFSAYIIYDTNMLATKHHPDDYILCALSLYLDVINLFLEILRIVGDRR